MSRYKHHSVIDYVHFFFGEPSGATVALAPQELFGGFTWFRQYHYINSVSQFRLRAYISAIDAGLTFRFRCQFLLSGKWYALENNGSDGEILIDKTGRSIGRWVPVDPACIGNTVLRIQSYGGNGGWMAVDYLTVEFR